MAADGPCSASIDTLYRPAEGKSHANETWCGPNVSSPLARIARYLTLRPFSFSVFFPSAAFRSEKERMGTFQPG